MLSYAKYLRVYEKYRTRNVNKVCCIKLVIKPFSFISFYASNYVVYPTLQNYLYSQQCSYINAILSILKGDITSCRKATLIC